MTEDPNLQKSKKRYSDSLGEVPVELIELATEEKTTSQILKICLENGIKDEKLLEEVAYQIGTVLFGGLPPEALPKAIERNLKIESEVAKKIYLEIDRSIFSPAKPALEKLYKAVGIPLTRPSKTPPQKKEEAPKDVDVYRELPE
jgi:hypothetical protein